jgi:hypothetical protein
MFGITLNFPLGKKKKEKTYSSKTINSKALIPVIKERDSNNPPKAAPIRLDPRAWSLAGVSLKEWM